MRAVTQSATDIAADAMDAFAQNTGSSDLLTGASSLVTGDITIGVVSLVVAIVAALAALASAVFAARSVQVSAKAYQAQTRPEVIVFLTKDPNGPGVALLGLKNIGSGAALDITVNLDRALPEFDDIVPIAEAGFMKRGVEFLEPGGERTAFVGFFCDLIETAGERTYTAVVRYSDRQGMLYEDPCVLSPISFEWETGNGPLSERYLLSIAESLKKMAQSRS